MSDSVDLVIKGFPYSTIEKHTGEPNYYTIKEVERKLIKIALSYPSELSGGNHRYLRLVLTNIEYTLIPNTQPFIQ